RQGEWFFVVPWATEIAEVEKALRGSTLFVRKKASINAFIPRVGKPHVADELVVAKNAVYVRGDIRHPDHKTMRLPSWRRVVKNREVENGRAPFGGTWID